MIKLTSILAAIFFCYLGSGCIPDPSLFPPVNGGAPKIVDPGLIQASQTFPQTVALEKELAQMYKAFNNSSTRVKSAKSKIKSARSAAEGAVIMIGQIKSVEDQISRLERELNSLKKIQQLKVLKPLATGVSSLKSKVSSIRKKAEKLRDQKIKPAIKKMKNMESKLAQLDSIFKYSASESAYAQRHVSGLKQFVISQQSPPNQVRALEALSRSARYPVTPAQKALSQFDSACSDVERQADTYRNLMNGLTRLKPGLDKVKKKMAPVDEKLKKLAKVLNKRVGFKKFSFTVRQVIEAPGKIADWILKPVTKAAKKLLEPITSKFKINIDPPAELKQISAQLDAINRASFNIDSPFAKFNNPANLNAIENYRAALKKLRATTTVSLTR